MRSRQVVVIGSHDEIQYSDEAYAIGRFIAQNDWVLITGGRKGVMEAASRGARESKGFVIGITPDSDFSTANKYCTAVIPTGIGYARNSINALCADVIVAIGGKSGTLTEISYAYQFQKPIICCMFTGGWSSLFAEFPGVKDCRNIYLANNLESVYAHLKHILG